MTDHLWIAAVGLAGFALLWPVSLWRRDASVVDFWWGPGFGAMALALWLSLGRPVDAHTLAILVPLELWAVRLGLHLGARRIVEGREDPRYAEIRQGFGAGWWWKSFFLIFMLQGFLQVLIAAGVLAGIAAAGDVAASPATWALAFVAVMAVGVETVSDLQLDLHRRRHGHGGLLTTGLRAHVRYPSYAAEAVFWLALSLMAVGAGIWWAWLSALIVGGLLRYVSGVAILEERLARTRPGFEAYRASVPALIPRAGRPSERQSRGR